jgi:hypothetical protein
MTGFIGDLWFIYLFFSFLENNYQILYYRVLKNEIEKIVDLDNGFNYLEFSVDFFTAVGFIESQGNQRYYFFYGYQWGFLSPGVQQYQRPGTKRF